MIRMFNETDDISMDVQVGPKEEIEATADTTPVDIAKMNPDNVVVAGKVNDEGVDEFYVDIHDVMHLARLHEYSIMDAMNDIIAANEDAGVCAQNMVMVVDESTIDYVRDLEECGVNVIRFANEADDISMDIQVGPCEDEIRVSEDPQEANPVDAVKREYDNVIVAKQGDEFFTDVEDVQKCAELNCESVIETLNGIIAANEDAGVCAQNLVVIMNENTDFNIREAMEDAGVLCESKESKARKNIGRDAVKIINRVLVDSGISNILAQKGFYNPIQSSEFNRGKTNQLIVRLIYRGGSYDASRDMDNAMAAIRKNKVSILKDLNSTTSDYEFTNLVFDHGIGATMDVIINCKPNYN